MHVCCSVGNPYFLRPIATVTYQRGMRCNLYPFVPICNPTCTQNGVRPNATAVPAHSFTFPQDCLAATRVVDPVTGITECKIRYTPSVSSGEGCPQGTHPTSHCTACTG